MNEIASTTTTTVAHAKSAVPSFGGAASLFHWLLIGGAIFLVVVAIFTIRPGRKAPERIGGKVIGIVGRMGSGKTYMAVMIAYRHLLAGHAVRTNFTMNLPPELQERWAYFTGWDQFADLDNCVVIIDEAQLYAPSYKPLAFPLIARWKLAMARKFRLDVYWVSQHEDRVNSTLKHLTNLIYVCNAWFGASYFSAKGYEPEYVRRKGKHLARQSYRFDMKFANLYDTLEVLQPDEHLGDEKVAAKLDKIGDLTGAYNSKRGTYGPCTATSKTGHPCTRNASSPAGLCGQHEKRGQTAEQIIEAAAAVGLDTDGAPEKEGKKPSKNAFRLVNAVVESVHGTDHDERTSHEPRKEDYRQHPRYAEFRRRQQERQGTEP